MAKLVEKETLDRMFDDTGKKHHNHTGRCCSCESDVSVTIDKTSSGYGFQGGVLYESNTGQILVQCERCFKNIGQSNHRGDTG